MITIEIYDIINIFAFASEVLHKEELNESQIETLRKLYGNCDSEQQEQLLDLFPEFEYVVSR